MQQLRRGGSAVYFESMYLTPISVCVYFCTVRCPSNETDSSSHASVAVRFPRIMGINNISAILAASSGDGSLDIIGSPSQQLEEAHHSTSTVFHHQSIGVAINGSDDDNDEPVQNNVVSVTATTTGDHRCNE